MRAAEEGSGIKILLADDEVNILESISAFLKHSGYCVCTASNGLEALECFRKEIPPLVLTDLKMPGMTGYDLLLEIKNIEPETEVIIITGYATIDGAVRAIKAGAYDYIIKPFKMDVLRHTLSKAQAHRALVQENRRLQENSLNVLRAMVNVIEQRDTYTAGHSRRVTEVALEIATRMEIPEEEMKILRLAGPIHDLGKIGIEDYILRKPQSLSDDEYAIIKTHPAKGVHIIEPLDFLKETIPIIRHHHERFDGRGYPDGLGGMDIPLGARILTVADTFDAITSSRAYRKARSMQEALDELVRCKDTQFDSELICLFLEICSNANDRIPAPGQRDLSSPASWEETASL